MKNSIHPAVIVIIVVVVLVVLGFLGFKALTPPSAEVSGIGKDGKPMTKQQIDEFASKMSGGKYKPKEGGQ